MSNHLYLIIFWILVASCKAPVSSLYQDNRVSLVSAEKTEWFGGRSGVKGATYTIKLKVKTKDIITVKSFRAEGNTVSFSQYISGSTLTVKGSYQYKNKEDNATADNMPTGSPVENTDSKNEINPKDSWIEYMVKNSKTLYKVKISKFVSVESADELIPQRQ
jgi:hypothetical protein